MPWKRIVACVLLIGVALGVSIPTSQAVAEETDKAAVQNELEGQLKEIEAQINVFRQQLGGVTGERNTLQNKIAQLQTRQSILRLEMQAISKYVSDLDDQYARTLHHMAENELKLRDMKQQIAEYVFMLYEQGDNSPLLAVLAEGKLSAFMDQAEQYKSVSAKLDAALTETRELNAQLEAQRKTLLAQQESAEQLLQINAAAQEDLADSMAEQNQILKQTRGRESEYRALLTDTQRRAADIRSRIYQLQGVGQQPTFGEALAIAQSASAVTGVRPAFLLAILTQESNLGKNVGTCNRPGDGPERSWKVIMKPDRDQGPFEQITQELGLDPNVTPVSCPMRGKDGKQIGWGGAMGPAQFIPSTWMGYKAKVSAITGKPANPWDIRDAFLAAGIKLAAAGATSQSGEWAAAMKYFSGSTNPQFRFYGDNVVATANRYQADIDALQ